MSPPDGTDNTTNVNDTWLDTLAKRLDKEGRYWVGWLPWALLGWTLFVAFWKSAVGDAPLTPNEWGDSFGGITGMATVFALMATLYSVHLQRKELSEAQEEMKAQTAAMQQQGALLKGMRDFVDLQTTLNRQQLLLTNRELLENSITKMVDRAQHLHSKINRLPVNFDYNDQASRDHWTTTNLLDLLELRRMGLEIEPSRLTLTAICDDLASLGLDAPGLPPTVQIPTMSTLQKPVMMMAADILEIHDAVEKAWQLQGAG